MQELDPNHSTVPICRGYAHGFQTGIWQAGCKTERVEEFKSRKVEEPFLDSCFLTSDFCSAVTGAVVGSR
jgi:hypothetical protein